MMAGLYKTIYIDGRYFYYSSGGTGLVSARICDHGRGKPVCLPDVCFLQGTVCTRSFLGVGAIRESP